TYTPAANYNGSDSFTYTVSDGNGGSNTYTVAITVSPVNDAPVAGNDSITTAEDTIKSGTLPAATDIEGGAITYARVTDASHGTVVINPNGSYIYLPAANYNGADSFTYKVTDSQGASNTYTVSVNVTPVNDAPTASGTAITTAEDTVKTGTLPAATDIDGDTVTYGKGSDPAHGTVVVNTDGTYTYTPAANYNGSDSFTYTVNDGNGGSNTYTVAITVTPVNDAPTAGNDSITTPEDTIKSGTLPAATDLEGDTFIYSTGTAPAHGRVVVNDDGSYLYIPAANYNGSDSFTYKVTDSHGASNTYTVSVNVTPVNDKPVASGTAITTNEDTVKTGNLPTATDVDGDAVTYGKGSDPAHGTVVINADGSYTYTPAANYNGADSFTYTVNDGNGGSNTYTVAITVSPVNDAPVAGNDSITTAEDVIKSGTLPAATDVDGDAVTYARVTDASHGTVVINPNGSYIYLPAANYNGADSFTYSVSDGKGGSNTYTVSVNVTPVNDVPTGSGTAITTSEDTVKTGTLPVATDVDGDTVIYGKASDPAHGAVVVNADGTYTYTPAANYNGADSFTYTVSDGKGGSSTYTVAITVTPVNDAPVAGNDAITLNEDTVKTGTLPLASDVDGDTVTYGKASDPAHGAVVVNTDGTYTYTPAANYNGADSFTYTVSDGQGGSNTYTVAITVTPVNDAPVAANDAIVISEDTVKTGTLPVATDIDGDAVTYTKAGDPSHGTIVVNADGTYTYTPAANYNGADSFTYTVSDGQGGSNTYTVAITVTPVNDAPVGSGATITTSEDTVKTGTLPVATDVDGDTLTYGKGSDPAHGTVTVNPDGSYVYTPAANYNGADSFTYTVSDGQGGSNTYTVNIVIEAVNDAPLGSGTTITTSEDTVKTGTLPVATDVDGDTLTYGKGSDPAHGTVTVNPDGTYVYTPAANYNGADSFTYTVSDGQGGSNTYTVAITVTPVNDAPVGSGTAISTSEDTVKAGTLPVATDVDGDTLTYGKGSDPAHGTVSVNPDGTYVYTPAANYNGADSFTYTVSDGKGGSNTYTVAITISPVNDVPVGSGATITTSEDTVKTGTFPVATDVDGDTLTYGKGSDPAHGTVTVNPDGTYVYTPAANYNGADSFTYTVSDGKGGSNTYTVNIVIEAVNDAPVGSGTTITTSEDTVKTGTLPVATDVDGDTLTYGKGSDPAHGTVTVNPDGSYVYTPAANYNGADSFTYTVSDGKGGSSTYTVAITITAVNDAPTASNGTASVDEDAVLSGKLPAVTDVDGDSATYVKAGDPAHGSLTVNTDGSYVYTPAANYNGTDSFSYTVSDGKGGSNTYTVNITVNPVNDAPVAPGSVPTPADLSAGVAMPALTVPAFTDIDNASLNYTATLANGAALPGWLAFDSATRTFSGTPASDAAGTYTVIVRASDGTASGSVSVNFTVLPLPPQPVAAPEPVAVPAPVVVDTPPVQAPLPVAALPPLPTFVPGTAIVDTRINPVEPVSVTGNDTLAQLDGRGIRAADLSNGEYRRAAEMSDLFTDNNGFRTVVAKAENPALMLFQGVPDQYTDNGRPLVLTIPSDAFVHTQPDAVVRLAATLQDGRPLPSWVQFDAQTGKFTGEVPKGMVGELRIKLMARDVKGHEATALFRINVGQAKSAMGKSGLSEQLRQVSAVNAAYRARA
ncbi:tandem-95 repeat protein, partial [Janthinobacterium sp.]|uniref:tandem-95 repeat protein n=1 Tax=Janthinobacterium sp. TaxID=1871054 RepID=UPI00289F5943